ncbi:protein EARLY RESPONSIVE TO DEHYDRATION 15-like [Cornus florida]|uniref:protein EARLY RESPONSIVE TO DEHYDRATION 15-like n=1 Tax=Cornus florida TaxID=4283 RepID=UPI00289D09CB|nr:protein EARLY RESPONSIVE TO DEHYDRATION 15-like [Cornus florida]XP_059668361.1 protein EARLY RESPONSIVE TO DEHYDRATION 15-like [Cornus florida]
MALVSGGRSTLNPNAPLFIPAAVRQVEDFSPEWWELVTTSTWFHDYWLSQNQGEDGFYGNDVDGFDGSDVAELLPDTIDLGADEDFSNMEAQFEEFIHPSEMGEANEFAFSVVKGIPEHGLAMDTEALMKSLSLANSGKKKGLNSPTGPPKYCDKPAKCVSSKCSPIRIQQPR